MREKQITEAAVPDFSGFLQQIKQGSSIPDQTTESPKTGALDDGKNIDIQIANAEFIEAIFSNLSEGAFVAVCDKAGDPGEGGWVAKRADADLEQLSALNNNYVNCSSFRLDADGNFKARKQQFSSFHCLVLDDVGTKVPWAKLGGFKPSWALETSPGNYQLGIILEPPLTEEREINQLQNAVVSADLCDHGASGLARWVRLPVGINGKLKYATDSGDAFNCRLKSWNPERRHTVEEVVSGLNIELAPERPSGSQSQSVERFGQSNESLADSQFMPVVGKVPISQIVTLLNFIDPSCGYAEWIRVLMAIFHETGGSDEGLRIADEWSSKGEKYKGIKDVEFRWNSFRGDVPNPVTVGTLIKMARDGGADKAAPMAQHGENFEVCEYEVIDPDNADAAKANSASNPLEKFSIRDYAQELERLAVMQKPLLGGVALLGQATVFYARANTGKTLIALSLIIEAINQKRVDPSKLYYVNMDDNSTGLAEKAWLASEFGFHMLADGHYGFEAKEFRKAMEEMIVADTANGSVIILDTLKKFVDTMDKRKSSDFARVVRRFVMKGGTVIALSHVNKNPGANGKAVYSGTTDIVDDFDCAYTIDTIPQDAGSGTKVVEFTNIKRRGNVVLTVGYSYASERGVSYNELLLSVQEVDADQLVPIKQAAAMQSDAAVIEAVVDSIKAGINTKMKLAEATAERLKVSRRAALKIIDKYTGSDPIVHRWTFEVRERGAKIFTVLEPTSESANDQTLVAP